MDEDADAVSFILLVVVKELDVLDNITGFDSTLSGRSDQVPSSPSFWTFIVTVNVLSAVSGSMVNHI